MLNFNPKPQPKCKHCGKLRRQHKAKTYNCPFGRGSHPHFYPAQFFEPPTTQIEDGDLK